MICPICGKELSDGARFCTGCGTRLEAPVSAPQAPASTIDAPSAATAPAPAKKKAAPKIPLLPIVAACLAIACFLLPFATFSAGGLTYDIRMLDVYTGIELLGFTVIEPTPAAALFIALPAVAVLVGLMGRGRWGNVIIELAGLALGALCIYVYTSYPLPEYVSLSTGFYGYALCAVVIVFSS